MQAILINRVSFDLIYLLAFVLMCVNTAVNLYILDLPGRPYVFPLTAAVCAMHRSVRANIINKANTS